jgi:hypothetical protein
MNSNINQNSDFVYDQFLNWLLSPLDLDPIDLESSSLELDGDRVASTPEGEFTELYLLNLEDNGSSHPTFLEIWSNSHPKNTMKDFNFVETRFQTLLKQKLEAEIASHPPLFPWETEIFDYESEETSKESLLASLQSWFPQLGQLSLPMVLPSQVLTQLLDGCLAALKSGRPQGARLIDAVSSLFPNQDQALNQIAGMVLLASSRSIAAQPKISGDYDQINSQQQMTVSMLAAQEIFKALTLNLSSQQRVVKKEWNTNSGVMTVEAIYEGNSVKVKAYLPQGGSLSCETAETSVNSERTYPGELSIELLDCKVDQTYNISIGFAEPHQMPLTFVLVINN